MSLSSSLTSLTSFTSLATSTLSLSLATRPTPEPSVVGAGRVYDFLGCYGSVNGFPGFNQAPINATALTPALCASSCGTPFFGLFENNCFCALTLADGINSVNTDQCDIPCLGAPEFSCGGLVDDSLGPVKARAAARKSKRGLYQRAISNNVLLDVYAVPGAPIATIVIPPTTIVATLPGTTVTVIDASVITVTQSCTYVQVCPTNPATVTEECFTTTSVVTIDATCPSPAVTIPMCTYVQGCSACGPHGENTITVTIPSGVTPGAPATSLPPAVVAVPTPGAPGVVVPGQPGAPGVPTGAPGVPTGAAGVPTGVATPPQAAGAAGQYEMGVLPVAMAAGMGVVSLAFAVLL